MTARETGVQTAPCPTCGNDLKAVDQPDGSTGYELCSKCFKPPTQKAEKAAAKEAAELHEIQARQTGTDVESEEDNA